MSAIRLSRSVRLTFGARSRPAIVANRQKPVLDGETDAFLDQSPCDAGNAGAVGALSHQFFEIGDGRERQGYGNAVSLGFFGGHGPNASLILRYIKVTIKTLFSFEAGSQIQIQAVLETCGIAEEDYRDAA